MALRGTFHIFIMETNSIKQTLFLQWWKIGQDHAILCLLHFIKIRYFLFFTRMHSKGFISFGLVISIFLLQLFCFGTFRLLSSLKAGINRHQICSRMDLFKYKNDILPDGILSSLSPAQSTRSKEEYGACVHSHAYALVRAWQECHLSESCSGYRSVLRISVLPIEACVKTDALFGAEVLNGSCSTAHL